MSSLRTQGRMPPALVVAKDVGPRCPKRGCGVWVPACAGTTCVGPLTPTEPPQTRISNSRHCERKRSNPSRHKGGLLRGACHRARVRSTRWLAMTSRHAPAPLAARCARVMRAFRPYQRAQGMPGARCARSLACKIKQAYEHSHHGHTGNTRHSPREWF